MRPSALALTSSEEKAGASHLGGAPMLIPGTPWPTFRGEPLAFVAQLRVAEIPAAVREALYLPGDGLLCFFYAAASEPAGDEPEHRGGGQVLRVAQPAGAQSAEPPAKLAPEHRFPPTPLRFVETSIPAEQSLFRQALGLAEDRVDDFAESVHDFFGRHEAPMHWLGGHAHAVQDDMESTCAIAADGLPVPAQAGAGDWRLLAQFDSDDALKHMWGDWGRLYFWIREDDLRAGRFANAWCIMQSN
jgi:uncharacterized protein YwqG